VRRWLRGLTVMAGVAAVGCSSSNSKGPGSTTDAATGSDAGASEEEGGASPSADAGPDATVASGNDAAADVMVESTSDASGDAKGSEAAGPWTPSSLTGLVLWLDGHEGLGTLDAGMDGGEGGAPIQWLDRSGYGNNAIGSGTPTIRATALDGQPAVHFGGTDYLLVQDSTSLDWGTQDFVLAVVVQHTTYEDGGGPAYGTLYSKQFYDVSPYDGVGLFGNTGGTGAILEQLNQYGTTEVTSGGSDYNDGVPFVVLIHRAGIASDGGTEADAGDAAPPPATASMNMLINAVDAGFASGAGYAENVSTVGYPARIGGTMAGQNLTGDIAEIIAVQGAVSDGDLQSLQAYLMNKYGL
jgi:hypothetical protein